MATEKIYNENDMNDVFNFELTKEQRNNVRTERVRIIKEEYEGMTITTGIINAAFERAMMLKYYAKK